ncbi:MAG: MerR family transcriptional regulator [Enterococcus sp.]
MNIKEVSLQFGISSATIRYYERIGLIPPVTRNENGVRNFASDDLCWLKFAKEIRDSGLSIEASIRYVHLYDDGADETIDARKQLLFEQRNLLVEKMNEMKASIDALNNRIEHIDILELSTVEQAMA